MAYVCVGCGSMGLFPPEGKMECPFCHAPIRKMQKEEIEVRIGVDE